MNKEEFEKLPKELQEKAIKSYKGATADNFGDENIAVTLEELFGEENLKYEPEIKTWEDLVSMYKHKYQYVSINSAGEDNCSDDMVSRSALALMKIMQLMPYYGGKVTQEDYKNSTICAVYYDCCDSAFYIREYDFSLMSNLVFHTKKQAEEFVRYNEDLLKDYFML